MRVNMFDSRHASRILPHRECGILNSGPMDVRFTNSYVERLFSERDMLALYHLVGVTSRERALPGEFWLFSRLLEWVGSTRSGVWQYYEGLSDETFERVCHGLDQFRLMDIAEIYRSGRSAWRGPEQAASLDEWLDAHAQQIESRAFDLIASRKELLMRES
jgi:hypothetical protein